MTVNLDTTKSPWYRAPRVWLGAGLGALSALGLPADRFEILLYQLVNLLRDGKPYKMGKRLGNLITIEEVVDETLRKIDPALVPTKAPLMGGAKGDSISPEQMEKIKKVLEEAAKKKSPEQH